MHAVTIGIPVYKRLHYLPGALRSVAAQDHPDIELIVSDNGGHGAALDAIVAEHYPGPYRIRRNPATVGIVEHYNQILDAATGRYFALLADDDEISPSCASMLARVLEDEPAVGVALPALVPIDEAGGARPWNHRGSPPPPRMSGSEFVRLWCAGGYRFICFSTVLSRTAELRAAGGYPPFPKGTSVDNALVLRLAVGRSVAFVPAATFRYRVYDASHGLSLSDRDLALDLRRFIAFLDEDSTLRAYARSAPREWPELRRLLIRMTWKTYWQRWRRLYRPRLSRTAWLRAAFAMPPIPAYYRAVARTLLRAGLSAAKRRVVPAKLAG